MILCAACLPSDIPRERLLSLVRDDDVELNSGDADEKVFQRQGLGWKSFDNFGSPPYSGYAMSVWLPPQGADFDLSLSAQALCAS